jgi:cytochrome d ubiquinol oxidase subunit II
VRLVTAGAAIFAMASVAVAAPQFYAALLLILFALFMRPLGIESRSKISDLRRRSAGLGIVRRRRVPATVPVAFGNSAAGHRFSSTIHAHHYTFFLRCSIRSRCCVGW